MLRFTDPFEDVNTIPMREEAKPHKVAVSSGTSGEIGVGSSN
jgi:IMP dehydrogenase/GMP reductase